MKRQVNFWQFVPAAVFALVALACPLSAQPTPTPVPTSTPTATMTPVPTSTATTTPTLVPTATPTIAPTPIALVSPWDVFNFFARLVVEKYGDVKLKPLLGILIWFEWEGRQYAAMFGINIETGQWGWIDTIPIEKEQELGAETRTH